VRLSLFSVRLSLLRLSGIYVLTEIISKCEHRMKHRNKQLSKSSKELNLTKLRKNNSKYAQRL